MDGAVAVGTQREPQVPRSIGLLELATATAEVVAVLHRLQGGLVQVVLALNAGRRQPQVARRTAELVPRFRLCPARSLLVAFLEEFELGGTIVGLEGRVRLEADALVLAVEGVVLAVAGGLLGGEGLEFLGGVVVLEVGEGLLGEVVVEGGVVADELLLDLLEDLLLALLEGLDVAVGGELDDLLDLVDEGVEVDEEDLVVDPVGLALVQRLHDLVELAVLALAVVLDELDQVAVLEVAAHPVLLLRVLQDAVPLEDVVLELPHVHVPVLEHLLPHPAQLRVHVVPALHQPQLELVLVAVRVGVEAAVRPAVDEAEPQPVDEAVLLEPHHDAVALLLRLDERHLGEVVLEDARVGGADEEVGLAQLEHAVEDAEVALLRLLHHAAPPELGVDDRLRDVVEQHRLALELALPVVGQEDQEALGPVGALGQLVLIVDGGEQSVGVEEDVVAVQEVVVVGSDGRDAPVVQQDPPPVLLERLDPAHVHRVLVVAVVERGVVLPRCPAPRHLRLRGTPALL